MTKQEAKERIANLKTENLSKAIFKNGISPQQDLDCDEIRYNKYAKKLSQFIEDCSDDHELDIIEEVMYCFTGMTLEQTMDIAKKLNNNSNEKLNIKSIKIDCELNKKPSKYMLRHGIINLRIKNLNLQVPFEIKRFDTFALAAHVVRLICEPIHNIKMESDLISRIKLNEFELLTDDSIAITNLYSIMLNTEHMILPVDISDIQGA